MTDPVAKLVTVSCALALAMPVLAACGDDDEDGGGSEAKKVSIEATGSGKNMRVDAPESVEGGVVEVEFENAARDPRDAQLIRVEGDHTAGDVIKVISREGGPLPGWMSGGGGVGRVSPGQSAKVTQELSEGRYVVIAGPEGEGQSATAELTVEGGEGGGELPEADGKITAKEYSFETSGLRAGRNKVEFENAGRELHHVVALPLRKGATLADARKAFQEEEGESQGPPPFDEKNGSETAVIDGGERQVVDLELKKGDYVMVCFIQDRKGGPPHVAKGMVSQATVR